MSEQGRLGDRVKRNRDQTREMLRMFETGDLHQVQGVIASDYHDHQAEDEDIGRGPAAFGRAVRAARRFGSPAISIEDVVAEADLVALRLVWEWKRPPGRRETIDLIRFKDGLATEHWGAPLR